MKTGIESVALSGRRELKNYKVKVEVEEIVW